MECRRKLSCWYLAAIEIVHKRNELQKLLRCHIVALCQCLGDLLIAVYIQPPQMLYHLSSEILRSRASNDTELMGFDDAHG